MVLQSNTLGNATLGTQVDLSGLQKGLKQGEATTEAATGKMGKSWGGLQGKIQGAASKVPVFGDQLAALATPMGAATIGIGAFAGAIGASVNKVVQLEQELRPMIQRSGLSAESLQVLTKAANRLGSEDGLEGVTDGAQELQLRLAEAVQDMSGPAVAAFEKLGLSSEELIRKSPEQSFLDVISALQGVTNAADRKFLADELMGGASEKLSGIVNASAKDFRALTDNIRENADIVSNKGIQSAREFNASMTSLKETFGGASTAIATALLPILNDVISGIKDAIPVLRDTFQPIWDTLVQVWKDELHPALRDVWKTFKDDLLPSLKEIWDQVSPILIPAIKTLAALFGDTLKTSIGVISGVMKTLAGFLSGDFSLAWQGVKDTAKSVLEGIISIYNNTVAKLPGISEIDMGKVETSIEGVATTSETEFGKVDTAVGNTSTAMGTAATSIGTTLNGQNGLGSSFKTLTETGKSALDELKDYWKKNSQKATAGTMVYEAAETIDGVLGETERKLTQLEIYRNNLEAARKKHHEEVSLPNETKRAEAEADEATKAWQQVEKGFGSADDPESHAGKMTQLRTAYFTKELSQINKAYSVEEGWYFDKHDKAWKRVREELGSVDDEESHLGKMNKNYVDALADLEGELDGHFTDVETSYTDHFKKIAQDTGIHLTNIMAMYAAAGMTGGDFDTVLGNLDTAISGAVGAWGGETALHRFSAGANLDKFDDKPHYALSYDESGRYLGAGLGTHDVHGRDVGGERTGIDTIAHLFPGVFSGVPLLPGMGDPTEALASQGLLTAGRLPNQLTLAELNDLWATLPPVMRENLGRELPTTEDLRQQGLSDLAAYRAGLLDVGPKNDGAGPERREFTAGSAYSLARVFLKRNLPGYDDERHDDVRAGTRALADKVFERIGAVSYRDYPDASWDKDLPEAWRAARDIWGDRTLISARYGFARGGIAWGPTQALIGEAGPEAVIRLDRMGEVMHSYMKAQMRASGQQYMNGGAGRMGGNTYINVHVNEGAYVFEDFVSEVQEALIDAERRGIV